MAEVRKSEQNVAITMFDPNGLMFVWEVKIKGAAWKTGREIAGDAIYVAAETAPQAILVALEALPEDHRKVELVYGVERLHRIVGFAYIAPGQSAP